MEEVRRHPLGRAAVQALEDMEEDHVSVGQGAPNRVPRPDAAALAFAPSCASSWAVRAFGWL